MQQYSEYFALNNHQKRELKTISECDGETIVTNAILVVLHQQYGSLGSHVNTLRSDRKAARSGNRMHTPRLRCRKRKVAMSEDSEVRIGLSEFLAQLVAELGKAQSQMEKGNLDYGVDAVTLELDIAFTLTQSVEMPNKVKPEFWVLRRESRDAEEGLPSAQGNMPHLILRLTPRLEDVHAGESEYVATISKLPPARLTDVE